MGLLRMELKVCEGCGALWVRPSAHPEVYCPSCARRLADFPPPRRRHSAQSTAGRRRGCAAAAVDGGAR